MLQKIACKLTGSPTLLALIIPIALASTSHGSRPRVPIRWRRWRVTGEPASRPDRARLLEKKPYPEVARPLCAHRERL
jgi:hypothetical protein